MESNHLSVKGQSVKSGILHKIENAVKNKVWIHAGARVIKPSTELQQTI